MTRHEILQRYPNASESFIRANLSAENSGSVAKLERSPGNEPLATPEVQEHDSRGFLVRVTSRRKRLLDEDNLCEKYHVDLCRYAGVIPDDSPGKTKIEVAQTKCRKGESEEIVVEVWSVKVKPSKRAGKKDRECVVFEITL